MNLSAAIMLVNPGIRPVKVEYDPDIQRNNNPNKLFKTLDKDLAKDDLVIVPTNTRHGFTIAKVSEIDFPVDFSSSEVWGWIGGKFDKKTYDEVLKIEDNVKHKVAKTQENKMRAELIAAAGLGEVSFDDVMGSLQPPATAAAGSIAPPPAPGNRPPGSDIPPPGMRRAPAPRESFSTDLDDEIPF